MEAFLKKAIVYEEKPPSRCEFVHRWLDAHQKYFHLPPPEPQWVTRVAHYSYGPNGVYCYYCDTTYATTNTLPYVVPAPYRISPVQPNLYVKKS